MMETNTLSTDASLAAVDWKSAKALRQMSSRLSACMLSVAAFLAGCGASDTAAGPDSDVSRSAEQSDLQVAQDLYRDTRRTPQGFSADPSPSGFDYIATVHLKNTDVEPTSSAGQPQYELCTDDWLTAFEWSEQVARRQTVYADLTATDEDPRYFEFDRMRSGNPSVYTRNRVFKCAYLDRSDADIRLSAGPAGTLNEKSRTADELRRLSEYLWRFTPYNNYGHAVLQSSGGTASGGKLSHTLTIATLVAQALSRDCDRIDVTAWRLSVDVATGDLQLNQRSLRSFGARNDFGSVQLCDR